MIDTENQPVSRRDLAAIEARGVPVEESQLQSAIRRYLEAKGLRGRAKDQDTDTKPAVEPGPGAVLWVGAEHEHPTSVRADAPEVSAGGSKAMVVEPSLPHVREWQVRVLIFESGDDTSANVVLLTEAPTHLTARGQSRIRPGDTPVPEIGDEVAVARAMRHLADLLLETAAQDIEAVSGGGVPQISPV